MTDNTQGTSETPRRGKSFSFGFSIGPKPAPHDARRQETLAPNRAVSIELSNGVLRIGDGGTPAYELDLAPEPFPAGPPHPLPALTAIHTWLQRGMVAMAIAVPVSMAVLGVASGQTTETTVYMALFGAIIGMMVVSSLMPRRSRFDRILEDVIVDTARRHMAKAKEDPSAADPAPETSEPEPAFTIRCHSCGASFTPAPPRAICPHCATPALSD